MELDVIHTEEKTDNVKASEETKEVEGMNYEQLENYLKEPEKKEPEKKEPEKKEPETKVETKVEPVKKEKQPETKTGTETGTKTETEIKPDYEALLKEHEGLKKKADNQEKLLARFGTEMGLLRKKTPEEMQKRIQEVRDKYNELALSGDVFAAQELLDNFKKEQREEEERQITLQNIEKIKETRENILTHIPKFESSIENIIPVLEEEGIGKEGINAFKQNPYFVSEGELRILHKASIYHQENVSLKKENETLKTKIAELEKKPGEIIEKINKSTETLSGKKTVTSTPKAIDFSTIDLSKYTYEQLRELEKTLSSQ